MQLNKKVKIKGMHCASCSQIIESRLKKVKGIKKISVSYATEKAEINFDPRIINLNKISEEIEKLGYKIDEKQEEANKKATYKEKVKLWFVLSVAFFIFGLTIKDLLSYFWPEIPALPVETKKWNLILMILSTTMYLLVGKPFLQGIINFVKYGAANMETLIGIGTGTAFVYSSIITLFPGVRIRLNLPEMVYFDAVIGVVGFVTLGKYLENRSKEKTGETIKKLLGLQAKSALVLRNKKEIEIPINEVVVGDILIIKPGDKIPVDGIITRGFSSINESMISGESVPVDKKVGDLVIGSTINKQGSFYFKATKIGNETMLSQIIKIVEESQGSKAPIQVIADKISAVFVPIVLVIGLTSFGLWLFIGQNLSFGILSLVGVLVIACPCALGLATPTAIIVGVGRGAENGLLIKNASSLERLSQVETVVLDKTGTITKGEAVVTEVVVIDKAFDKKKVLKMAASVENLSEHPLAETIVNKSKEEKITLSSCRDFKNIEGVGVTGKINSEMVEVKKTSQRKNRLVNQGKTVVDVVVGGKIRGQIAMSDTLKEEAVEMVEKLHKQGIKVLMITGDNKQAATFIGDQVGIDEILSEVMPSQKSQKIKELQDKGVKVAMVGDGVNDAPALVQANVGIAMATGSDIAIESAGITILGGEIKKIPLAIELAKATMVTVKQNLFWAFIYNLVGIPMAAGLLYPFFGIFLNPIFAGIAMSLSSVSVVSNSLRLRIKKLK